MLFSDSQGHRHCHAFIQCCSRGELFLFQHGAILPLLRSAVTVTLPKVIVTVTLSRFRHCFGSSKTLIYRTSDWSHFNVTNIRHHPPLLTVSFIHLVKGIICHKLKTRSSFAHSHYNEKPFENILAALFHLMKVNGGYLWYFYHRHIIKVFHTAYAILRISQIKDMSY